MWPARQDGGSAAPLSVRPHMPHRVHAVLYAGDVGSDGLRVRGGATLPYLLGWYYLPYPWAWLETDQIGVTVVDSFGFLALFDADRWSVAWADIRLVEVAGRSVRVYPRDGRSCRFSSFSGKRIALIEEHLHHHGVRLQRVSTTVQLVSWLRQKLA